MLLGIIDTNLNRCVNVTKDNRPIDQIPLPSNLIAIDILNTPSQDWVWNDTTQEYDLVDSFGEGGVGDIWDGVKLTQPEKPPRD